MLDFMQQQKQQLAQAKTHTELADKYSQRRLKEATAQSKRFLASPTAIAGAFALGAIKGASQKQTRFFSVLPTLIRTL